MPAELIDRAWIIAHGGTQLVMHLNMGDQHQLVRDIVDRRTGRAIGIRCHSASYKRTKRNGPRGGTSSRTWIVSGHAGDLATLDEALEILAIQRAADEPAEPEA